MPTISAISPANGAAGDVVHIFGSGLGAVTAVHFGTTPAAFRIIDAGQVDATVPRTRGTSDTLTVVDGSGSDTGTFTVLFAGPWQPGKTETFTVTQSVDAVSAGHHAGTHLSLLMSTAPSSFADVCEGLGVGGSIGPSSGFAVAALAINATESGDPASYPGWQVDETVVAFDTWNGSIPTSVFGPLYAAPPGAVDWQQDGSTGHYDTVTVTTQLTTRAADTDYFPESGIVQMRRILTDSSPYTGTEYAALPLVAEVGVSGSGGETVTLSGTADVSDMGRTDEFSIVMAPDALISHVAPTFGIPPSGHEQVFGPIAVTSGVYEMTVTFTAGRWRWLYAKPAALPPLRQFPRDDALGGAPRQGHQSQSIQASARQGWLGSYR